jgi:simple sugar transport system substrate-binding protein
MWFQVFKGPLRDNQGHVVIPEGKGYDETDGSLWGMNYLVEGVIGSTGR